jgi:hypothetical protein
MQGVLEHPFLTGAVDATQQLSTQLSKIEGQNEKIQHSLDNLSKQLDSVRHSVLRGMLSIDQAPIPSLWILVPPPQVTAPPSLMFV